MHKIIQLLVQLGERVTILGFLEMFIRFPIGSDICAILMADAVTTGEVNYLFDSANFHTSRRGSTIARFVFHCKQPCFVSMVEVG